MNTKEWLDPATAMPRHDELVQVRRRSGMESSPSGFPAGSFHWADNGEESTIVGYRVVSPERRTVPTPDTTNLRRATDWPEVIDEKEFTGGSVDYYKVEITNPTTAENLPYMAECNDIIEALNMNYAEGNAFKAIWRSCASRALGKSKKGYDDGKYDAEKVVFFGGRMVEQRK